MPIHEVGEHQGHQYFLMKFVEGTSLAKHPRASVRDEVKAMIDVIRAVHHAHQRGVLHRDLKPSNVLVDSSGTRLVADFGLAKRMTEVDRSFTETGQVLGTPKYMSPEQAAGRKDLTVAADVYSLGVILYERLTGQTPFTGENALTLLRQVRESQPPRPSTIRAGLDRDLETVVLKCLEKEPGRRYESADALAIDLSNWLAGRPVMARRARQAERLWRWCKRNPAVAGLLLAVAASLLIGTIISTAFGFWALRNARRADRLAVAEREESRRASAAARKAIEEKETSDQLRYVAEINAAVRDYQAGSMTQVRTRLAGLIPSGSDEIDLRGIEWYHLQQLLDQSLSVFALSNSGVGPIAFSSNGRRMAAGAGNEVYEWDMVNDKPIAKLKTSGQIEGIAYGPDGVVVVHNARQDVFDGTILLRVWDPKTGNDNVIVHTAPGHHVALSPDGCFAALITYNKGAELLDLATGRVLAGLKGNVGFSSALSSFGSRLTYVNNNDIYVWDAESDPVITADRIEPLFRGEPLPGALPLPEISSNGRFVAVSAREGIPIWDVVKRHQVARLLDSGVRYSDVSTVAFSLENRQIVTGHNDGAVRIWEVQTGRVRATLRGHQGSVHSVAAMP